MNAIQFTYNIFFNITRVDGSLNGIACAMYLMMLVMVAIAIIEYRLGR